MEREKVLFLQNWSCVWRASNFKVLVSVDILGFNQIGFFFYSSGSVINFVDIFGNAGKDIF